VAETSLGIAVHVFKEVMGSEVFSRVLRDMLFLYSNVVGKRALQKSIAFILFCLKGYWWGSDMTSTTIDAATLTFCFYACFWFL
jgi:hypothetical protein